jgi:hypothetical protein
MNHRNPLFKQRFYVLLNYSICILMFVWLSAATGNSNKLPWLLAMLLSLVVGGFSFYIIHIKSDIWKLTHKRTAQLDERELKLTQEALSKSYSLFTLICLLAFYLILLAYKDPLNYSFASFKSQLALFAFLMIYVAHTLPGAFIAWKNVSYSD